MSPSRRVTGPRLVRVLFVSGILLVAGSTVTQLTAHAARQAACRPKTGCSSDQTCQQKLGPECGCDVNTCEPIT
jgi:hypothetical protein